MRGSGLFPLGQGHQFVHDFLQALQSAFLVGGSDQLFATLQVLAVRLTDFRDFLAQFPHSLFDGSWHENRLAEHFTYWPMCFQTISIGDRVD